MAHAWVVVQASSLRIGAGWKPAPQGHAMGCGAGFQPAERGRLEACTTSPPERKPGEQKRDRHLADSEPVPFLFAPLMSEGPLGMSRGRRGGTGRARDRG